MRGQAKYFAKTKYINFQIEDEELLEAYNKIWKRMKKLMKKGFNNEPTHDEKSSKTKVKSDNGETNTYVHGNKMPKEDEHCVSLLIISIDLVFKIDKSFCLQVFLEECE